MKAKLDKIVLEVRSAEGGDDAKLFVETMEKMYIKFCQRMGFTFERIKRMGYKIGSSEIDLRIVGEDAYR